VLNRRFVPPRNLITRQSKRRSDPIALCRARRPPAKYDRQYALLVQPGPFGEFGRVEGVLATEFFDGK
jgi:hypothetical protein